MKWSTAFAFMLLASGTIEAVVETLDAVVLISRWIRDGWEVAYAAFPRRPYNAMLTLAAGYLLLQHSKRA